MKKLLLISMLIGAMPYMACSGKYNLTADRLKPIIDQRRVIALHPDKDGEKEWREKLEALGYNRAYINDAIIKLRWKSEDGEKADDADVLIREMYERRQGKTMKLSEVMELTPGIKLLIDKFDLKQVEE